ATASRDHGHRRLDGQYAFHPLGHTGRLPRARWASTKQDNEDFSRSVGFSPAGAAGRPAASRRPQMRSHRIGLLWIASLALVVPEGAGAADAPSLELVQTIVLKGKAGKLDHLAIDSKRGRLFLANTTNGTLDVVDLKAGKLLKQVTGQTGIQ